MLKAAPKPCSHPGCGVLVHGGPSRCEAHQRDMSKSFDARRESSTKRGYGHKWRLARAAFLEQNPLCVMHEARGELVPAAVVDHKTPHRGDMGLFWRRSNWQALCKRCHDFKTATEDSHFARRTQGEGVV